MKQTGMGPRAAPMRLCGKPYDTAKAAGDSPRGQAGGRVEECPDETCGKWHVRAGAARSAPVLPSRPRATGFPARVKLAVRVRAGMGDAGDAVCESCGRHLGRYGGQIQHIIARGMGGTSNPALRTAVNAALLCGLTPQDPDGCHYRAESRDAGMRERGFWLPQGSDPRLEPMTLHGGVVAWRSEDGRYLFEPPEGARAA
jgi:hypothetical protein